MVNPSRFRPTWLISKRVVRVESLVLKQLNDKFGTYWRKYGHRQCPDLTGDWSLDDSLGDGGHGVPLLEALTYTRCGELLQLGCE